MAVDDIILELKAFRVVGEFYFQGFYCPVAYVINKISLVSFPGTANFPKDTGSFARMIEKAARGF